MDLVISCGFAPSKGAARRLIEGGGIYINNRRVSDVQAPIDLSTFIEGQFLVLRKGAKKYHLVRAK
jgi:tyrosyl-tRNA synthetase